MLLQEKHKSNTKLHIFGSWIQQLKSFQNREKQLYFQAVPGPWDGAWSLDGPVSSSMGVGAFRLRRLDPDGAVCPHHALMTPSGSAGGIWKI